MPRQLTLQLALALTLPTYSQTPTTSPAPPSQPAKSGIPADTLAEGNILNPNLKTKGPYRRSSIDYAADPHAVLFTQLRMACTTAKFAS
jgi:hypothetical protein